MTLDSKWDFYEEAHVAGEGHEGREVQPPINGELGVIGTFVYAIDEGGEHEEEADNQENDEEPPRTPNEEDLNEMLLD